MLKTIKKINNVIRKMCVCLLPVICSLVQFSDMQEDYFTHNTALQWSLPPRSPWKHVWLLCIYNFRKYDGTVALQNKKVHSSSGKENLKKQRKRTAGGQSDGKGKERNGWNRTNWLIKTGDSRWWGSKRERKKGVTFAIIRYSNHRYFSTYGRSSWYVHAYIKSEERLVWTKSPLYTFKSFVSATEAV